MRPAQVQAPRTFPENHVWYQFVVEDGDVRYSDIPRELNLLRSRALSISRSKDPENARMACLHYVLHPGELGSSKN